MKEQELIRLWQKSRQQIIFAQLAPTFLLITTVSLIAEVRAAGDLAVAATIGILLASGILGALAEYSAADEAQSIARDLSALKPKSSLARTVIKSAPWLHVVKFVTPAIFVAIFVALLVALLA
ncbi:MAG: hypothetical protein F2599_05265 [Actinobacteria bacterium]|uniref:Unannotated protein n=1 Tax=freshwater metagenome TaxID=449393 RepID=A0A6J6ITQ5_9ZZZZ|nr:hypothetical protein [Actinomycetota bacterium]